MRNGVLLHRASRAAARLSRSGLRRAQAFLSASILSGGFAAAYRAEDPPPLTPDLLPQPTLISPAARVDPHPSAALASNSPAAATPWAPPGAEAPSDDGGSQGPLALAALLGVATLITGTWVFVLKRRLSAKAAGIKAQRETRRAPEARDAEPTAQALLTRNWLLEKRACEQGEELQRRTAEVEALTTDLDTFVYSVSHDLRAPLRHMDGYTRILEENEAARLGEDSKRCLERIRAAVGGMSRLIDDLVSLSRIGRAPLEIASVDLNDVLRSAVRELAPETEGRQVRWVLEPLPRARADTALIRQVLVSYLSNAIKYTRTRAVAEIRVGTQKAGSSSEVIVYVHDNGVGFDRAYVSKLFRPFQRLHSQAEFEGSGMGLANAHRVISRHGGKTWAEAQPDQGATFYFSLPAHPQEANAGTRAEAGTQAFSDGPANSAARSAPKSSA